MRECQGSVLMNRREEQRAATLAEIKAGARRLLVSGGVAAIGLRAVAREVNLTAPALYRYFPSHDALRSELIADLYDELTTALMELGGEGDGDLSAQLYLLANGLRDWARAHP